MYFIWIREANEVEVSAANIVIDLSLISASSFELHVCLWTEITHFQLTVVSRA